VEKTLNINIKRPIYDNCKREAGESVRAFACRVQKLLRKGYPVLVEGKNQETIEQFSRHKFVEGLSVDLQDSASNLHHSTN
jgi:hypothetical protein